MSPLPVPQRVDQGFAHVVIAGRDCGEWPIKQGGNPTASSNKARLGYGLPEIEMGGPMSMSDVTVEKVLVVDEIRDLKQFIRRQAGKAESVITPVRLDAEGFVVDADDPELGKLLVANWPDIDVNSQDAAMVHLEFGMHGIVG